jgi:hypothetical protein
MHPTRVHLSSPRASACGIPASRLLSALDHDKAYNYLDACTVHRVFFNNGRRADKRERGGESNDAA